jgi:hypothetical protein
MGPQDDFGTPDSASVNQTILRLGGLAGIAGIVVEIGLAGLHAGHTDPNDSARVFREYADSGIWTAVHIGQYFGTFLIVLAFLAVYRSLSGERGVAAASAGIAGIAITVVLAVFAVQMAVDGVALRETIKAWLNAPAAEATAAFYVADGVRWIEKGLSAFFHLNNGTALFAFGVAVLTGRTYARWLGVLGVAAGAGTVGGGVIAAHTGFSSASAAVLQPSALLAAAFLVALSISMWRHSLKRDGRATAAPATVPAT